MNENKYFCVYCQRYRMKKQKYQNNNIGYGYMTYQYAYNLCLKNDTTDLIQLAINLNIVKHQPYNNNNMALDF